MITPITALLVDDETAALVRLSRMLQSFSDIEVIGTTRSVADAERFLRLRTPGVVFLDMTMPGRLGLELLGSLPAQTRVIFVTANETFAVNAFDHGAVDFLLKPYDHDRLEVAIGRLRNAVATATPEGPTFVEEDTGDPGVEFISGLDGRMQLDSRFVLSSERGRSVERVCVADIVWIMAVENYSQVQLRERPPVVLRRRLAEWSTILPEPAFHRIDRSLILQIGRLVRTQRQSRDQTLLFFEGVESPLPVGRTATTRLRELIDR